MRKFTSLLLLFLCGMAASWAQYSVGRMLTAEEVNEGVSQVCLFIDQDQGIHFYITATGQGSQAFSTEDETNIFDFVKVEGGVALRNSEGQYVCNDGNALAWSEDVADAVVFTAVQRETGVEHVNGDSSEAMGLIDNDSGLRFNSIDISGQLTNYAKFNGGMGVWTCFRVYEVNYPYPILPAVQKFTLNCARGYVYGTGSVPQGTTDASQASEFALVPYGETEYLYDATNKMFAIGSADDQSNLPNSGESTVTRESATDLARIIRGVAVGETGFDSYPVYLYDEYDNYLNMDGSRRVYFNTWKDFEGAAGGNTYVLTETEILSEEAYFEAVALLDAYFNPGASYNIIVFDAVTEKEYTVATGIPAAVGDVISALPEEYVREYCNYVVAEPLTVEDGPDNNLIVEVYYTLPFTTGKWYNAAIRGSYYLNTTHTGSKEGAYYPTSTIDTEDDSYVWGFKGNPYEGFVVLNYAHPGQSLTEDGDIAVMKDGEFKWEMLENESGFVLRVPGTSTKYVNQNGGTAGYLGYRDNTLGRTDAGSTITITEVEPGGSVAEDLTTYITQDAGTGNKSGWFATWTSTESDPRVTFAVAGGANNMTYNGQTAPYIDIRTGAALRSTYNISLQDGYLIKAIHFTGTAISAADQVVTYGEDGTYTFPQGEETTLDITLDEPAQSYSFTIAGSNTGISGYITLDVKQLVTEPVYFSIGDAEGHDWYGGTVDMEVGTVVSELPESLQRPFTEYTYRENITVTKGAFNQFYAAGTFTAFQTGKPYYIQTGSERYLHTTAEGALEATTEAPADETDEAYQFVFTGNPYAGYTVKNVATGSFLSVPEFSSFSTGVGLAEEGTAFSVADQDGHVVFTTTNTVGGVAALGDGSQSNGGYDANALCVWTSYAQPDNYGYTVQQLQLTPLAQEEETDLVNIVFTVYAENGDVLAEETVPCKEGTKVEDLPESMKRDFTNYITSEAFTVSQSDELKEFFAVARFRLPFTASTASSPAYYYLSIGDKYYTATATNAVQTGGEVDGINTTPYTLEQIQAMEEAESAGYKWTFYGNPYTGIKVRNAASGLYMAHPVGNDVALVEEGEAAVYQIVKRGTGFSLTLDDAVLRDVYDILSTRTYGDTDENAVFTVTKAEAPAASGVEVTVVIVDGEGNEYASATVTSEAGTVISTVPNELVRPYCSYEVPEPLTVTAGGENTLYVEVTFEDAPFVSTVEEPVYQNIIYTDDEGDSSLLAAYYIEGQEEGEESAWYVMGYVDNENTRANALAQWLITGNPYGYKFYNRGAEAYVTGHFAEGADNTFFTLEDEATPLPIAAEEDGLFGFSGWYMWGYWSMLITEEAQQSVGLSMLQIVPITTGIRQAETTSTENATIFDLQGRRVQNGTAKRGGVYIVNGKKVVF
ncbi:MAG: hypothetical protein IJ692_06120 [Alloprevotella sp.]|nr:hypothetical protein [Alloprevotella sp.]